MKLLYCLLLFVLINWANALCSSDYGTIDADGHLNIIDDGTGSIAESSFSECSTLKSIHFPDEITEIGDNAFYNSDDVHTITGGINIVTIGLNAFYKLGLNTNIDMGWFTYLTELHTVGYRAFKGAWFEHITFPTGVLLTIGEEAFDDVWIKTVVFSNTVVEIGKNAFSRNKWTSITLGSNIQRIYEAAFAVESTYTIPELILPSSLLWVGRKAFEGLTVQKLVIPDFLHATDSEIDNKVGNPMPLVLQPKWLNNGKIDGDLSIHSPVNQVNGSSFLGVDITTMNLIDIGYNTYAFDYGCTDDNYVEYKSSYTQSVPVSNRRNCHVLHIKNFNIFNDANQNNWRISDVLSKRECIDNVDYLSDVEIGYDVDFNRTLQYLQPVLEEINDDSYPKGCFISTDNRLYYNIHERGSLPTDDINGINKIITHSQGPQLSLTLFTLSNKDDYDPNTLITLQQCMENSDAIEQSWRNIMGDQTLKLLHKYQPLEVISTTHLRGCSIDDGKLVYNTECSNVIETTDTKIGIYVTRTTNTVDNVNYWLSFTDFDVYKILSLQECLSNTEIIEQEWRNHINDQYVNLDKSVIMVTEDNSPKGCFISAATIYFNYHCTGSTADATKLGLNIISGANPLDVTLYDTVSKPMGLRVLNQALCQQYADDISTFMTLDSSSPYGCSMNAQGSGVYFNDRFETSGSMWLSEECGTDGWMCIYLKDCNDAETCNIGDTCTMSSSCADGQICMISGSIQSIRPFYSVCNDGNTNTPPLSCECVNDSDMNNCTAYDSCINDEVCIEEKDCLTGYSCYKADDDYFSLKDVYVGYLTKCLFDGSECRCYDYTRGPQGVQGERGGVGPRGFKGDIGAQGPRGDTGVIGSTGPTGIQGPTGSVGNTGPTGIQGEVGPTGEVGAQGAMGEHGSTGLKGDKGIQGVRGLDGHDGLRGEMGPPGHDVSSEDYADLVILNIILGSVSFVAVIVLTIIHFIQKKSDPATTSEKTPLVGGNYRIKSRVNRFN